MMKFLILSTATGQGHNSASLAVAETLRAENCIVKIGDVLKAGKRDISEHVSKLYSNVTLHMPRFFGGLYHAGELVSSSKMHSPIYRLNSLYAGNLYDRICRFEPDVIVCTHIFGAQAITCIRKRYGLKTPTAGIATDYTCSPFWEESKLDGYIIPSAGLTDEFAQKGIPAGKIIPIGIPVRPQFQKKITKQEAREKFGITAKHLFLVMGGSMGYGNIETLTASLLEAVPDTQVAAVCGKNEKLFHELSGITNAVPFEYVENISELMDAADVILTKPGGLTSTEALVKHIPTVLTRPIPGCEQHNAEYLSSLGAAAFADNTESAVGKALHLLNDADAAAKMTAAQEKYICKDASKQICDYLIRLGKSFQEA